MTWNDLEFLKLGVLVIFWRFLDASHTRVTCDEMVGDRLKQPANRSCVARLMNISSDFLFTIGFFLLRVYLFFFLEKVNILVLD